MERVSRKLIYNEKFRQLVEIFQLGDQCTYLTKWGRWELSIGLNNISKQTFEVLFLRQSKFQFRLV